MKLCWTINLHILLIIENNLDASPEKKKVGVKYIKPTSPKCSSLSKIIPSNISVNQMASSMEAHIF